MIITANNYVLFDVIQYLKEFNLTGKFNQFMVDIESTGTSPDRNHVVEICIVPFNLISNVVHISPPEYHLKFKLNDQQLGRQYDQQTMIWWSKQNKAVADSVFSQFLNENIDNKQVLLQLAVFVSRITTSNTEFWSKPNSFDFMFLQSLFKDFQVIFPFKYYLAKDLAGFCSGISFIKHKTMNYRIYEPLERHGAHDSMNDCYYQLQILNNAVTDNPESATDEDLPF